MSNETFEKVYINSEADLPKEYGEYFVGVNKRIDTWVFNPNEKEIGLNGSDKEFWLNHVDWYLSPISQQNEAQGKLDLKELARSLDEALSKETEESINEFLDSIGGYKWIEDMIHQPARIEPMKSKMEKDEPLIISDCIHSRNYCGWMVDHRCDKNDCPAFTEKPKFDHLINEVSKTDKPDHIPGVGKMIEQPERRTAESILHKHIDKESMDELSVNVWPDMIDAMQEYAREGVPSVSDEEIEAFADNWSLHTASGDRYGNYNAFKIGAKWAIARMNQTKK